MAFGRMRIFAGLLAAVFCLPAAAQYTAPYVGITGTLSSSNGMPAQNYTITLNPSQVMYVGGTSALVSGATCATDTNGGVVGTANPNQPAVLAAVPGTGSLPAGNYYVEITWGDASSHQTLPSPEAVVQLTTTGSITVSPPTGGAPLSATAMNVYIGASSGSETYQGQVSNPTSSFTQSTALATGAALPIRNNTVCVTVANDAAWPIGGYIMTVTTPAGNTVPGFPQQVQFIGPGSAFNISSGLPLWNGRVTYPVPILTLPYNHNAQSISGPLSMTGYNVYNVGRLGVATSLPAYGVDVEGTGASAAVNANQGFLVNGAAGTSGQCLLSDGTYFDVAGNCFSGTIWYQTIYNGAGTAMPQQLIFAFGSEFSLTNVLGPPGKTEVDLAASGVTAGTYTNPTSITVDQYGRITAIH